MPPALKKLIAPPALNKKRKLEKYRNYRRYTVPTLYLLSAVLKKKAKSRNYPRYTVLQHMYAHTVK